MKKLKNRLIIYKLLIFSLLISFNFNVMAENTTILPTSGIIRSISDKLILSVQGSPVQIELPYIYIPHDLLPATVENLRLLAVGKEFSFTYQSINENRHGYFAATAKGKNGKSLQEELLENGLAYVYFLDSSENNKSLFNAEERARIHNIGKWQKNKDSYINSNDITKDYNNHLNHFLIVYGEVKNIYVSKKNIYLNFGEDWKTDFTVQLDHKTLKNFPSFIPEKLTGKKIRVRGWLESYNGPFIKIFNPENIEVISGK